MHKEICALMLFESKYPVFKAHMLFYTKLSSDLGLKLENALFKMNNKLGVYNQLINAV
jgi:hypothetical protein